MSLQIGIVGLPNVGKSTLFNALLKKQAALAANYPFATIEPNVGVVPVPDFRLERLARIIGESSGDVHSHPSPLSEREGITQEGRKPPIVPATVEFVDIAGLVKGASEGAGLGNKFLSHIRTVSVIAHVVRAFVDENVIREGSVDPKSDYETIKTELILADIQTLDKVNEKALKLDPIKKSAVDTLKTALNSGKSAYEVSLSDKERDAIQELGLLSAKPEIIVLNVSEQDYNAVSIEKIIEQWTSLLNQDKAKFVVICAKIESELAELSDEDQVQYLRELGLEKPGLERLIQKAYGTLGLQSFLTAGEKEVRAWTIQKGSTAPEAAGVIHTDFIKNFIKAEVVSFPDFVQLSGWKGAREKGKARMEGRDYIMQDGDVVEFKIGR